MKILALPRDANPYQTLLYGEMERLGAQVSYMGRLTPSRTLNLIFLPLELFRYRLRGGRLVHLHWVFVFAMPGGHRMLSLRRLAQVWFTVWLRTARLLGLRLVWTAHNVLPHSPVFADEAAARQALVKSADLVIAHSPVTLRELASLEAVPRRAIVIPHGPFGPTGEPGALRVPGAGGGPRHFLFLGQIREYKGIDDLLLAFTALPDETRARLTVGGECPDAGLRAQLERLAHDSGGRVTLRLNRVPDEDVTPLLAAADVVVLPYRRVTTSGSAMLALAHGRPLVVPNLEALSDLPDKAVDRYDGTVPGLTRSLIRLARTDSSLLKDMSTAARSFAAATTWQEIAAQTMKEMAALLDQSPAASRMSRHGGTAGK